MLRPLKVWQTPRCGIRANVGQSLYAVRLQHIEEFIERAVEWPMV
jgi:hypothetical protein